MQRRRVLICFSAGVGLAGLAFGDVGSIVEEWRWSSSPTLPAYDQVEMTPIVVNLTDDNDDGTIDELDVPDVVFSNLAGTQGLRDGIVRGVNGNDGTAILPETGCVGVAVAEVLCAVDPAAGPTGDYDVTLTVTNDSGIPARYILLPDPVTAPDFIALADALPGDGSSTTVRITLTGVTPLTEACFMIVLADENVDECCAGEEVCVTVPECDCLQATNAQFDCDPATGAFALEFDLTNLTADDVEHVYVLPPLAPAPGSDVVIPDSYTDVPTILPYQTAHIGPITLENAIDGTSLDLRVTTHVESFAECCSEVVTFTLPSCTGGEVPCECDLDDDVQVGFSDLTQLLSAWGAPSTVEPGCDGANGFSDLTNLLSKWGRCPDAPSP